ncbi:MAG: hypothetical protein Q9219_005909, partial [cf. Caloplaca sp. 3 TL-2023]
WFDWYRGYTIIKKADGTEERQDLIGEALSEVPLGHLPRTPEQLQAPAHPQHPSSQQHQVHQRIPISSSQNLLSDSAPFDERGSPDLANTYENATRQSSLSPSLLGASHAIGTPPDIDPEDRIFDSSSESTSPFISDAEDHEEDTISADQRLLIDLQQNLEDVRANILQLTRRFPLSRGSSQTSSVTNQVNALTRRITRIRNESLNSRQDPRAAQTMSSPPRGSRGQNPNPLQPSSNRPAQPALRYTEFSSLSNEDLRVRIRDLARQESEAQDWRLGPATSSDEVQARIATRQRLFLQRNRAEQELRFRRQLPRMAMAGSRAEGPVAPAENSLAELRSANRAWTSVPRQARPGRSHRNPVDTWNSPTSDHAASTVWMTREGSTRSSQALPNVAAGYLPRSSLEAQREEHEVSNRQFSEYLRQYQAWYRRREAGGGAHGQAGQLPPSLDNDSTRPAPLTEAAMTMDQDTAAYVAGVVFKSSPGRRETIPVRHNVQQHALCVGSRSSRL